MSDQRDTNTSGPEQVDAQLLAFADRLRSLDEADADEETPEVWVSFVLAGRPYALPVTHVREYTQVGKITRVPGAPDVVCGVASLRGHAIPVVDLRRVLGLVDEDTEHADRVLVAEQRGRWIGLLIDEIGSVVKLFASQITRAPARSGSHDKLLGFYEFGGENLALLSAETFLSGMERT